MFWDSTTKSADLTLVLPNSLTRGAGNTGDTASIASTSIPGDPFYIEFDLTGTGTFLVGLAPACLADGVTAAGANDWLVNVGLGTLLNDAGSTSLGVTWTPGTDVIGFAVDPDTGKVWVAKNNTYVGSGDPEAGTDETFTMTGTQLVVATMTAPTDETDLVSDLGDLVYAPPTGFGVVWSTADIVASAGLPEPAVLTDDGPPVAEIMATTSLPVAVANCGATIVAEGRLPQAVVTAAIDILARISVSARLPRPVATGGAYIDTQGKLPVAAFFVADTAVTADIIVSGRIPHPAMVMTAEIVADVIATAGRPVALFGTLDPDTEDVLPVGTIVAQSKLPEALIELDINTMVDIDATGWLPEAVMSASPDIWADITANAKLPEAVFTVDSVFDDSSVAFERRC